MNLSRTEKFSYGAGAVAKDMVYMLSANYILYYYKDLLGIDPMIMGFILLAARVFDAFNDPIMGVLVAKTKTKFGRFRPWLFIGTVLNAVVLFAMFSAPPALDGKGLVAYAAITYILWGVTYTMMDIPFWSMIPAFTKSGKEREGLTTLARSCAGVGSALMTIFALKAVYMLGNNNEIVGFRYLGLIVAIIFVVVTTFACFMIKEKSTVEVDSPSVGAMFKALLRNDQAVAIVVTIVLVNCSLYITSNLLIFFFKYDIAGEGWFNGYTLFNAFGGGIQILSMMIAYPLLRKFLTNMKICYLSFAFAVLGYGILFVLMCMGIHSLVALCIPAFFIFVAFGLLTVLTTVFLANTVDYGELKNGTRDESVIFSMQTFVVKLASGVAAWIASFCLKICDLSNDTENVEEVVEAITGAPAMILRMTMTVLPISGLLIAVVIFYFRYKLNEKKLEEITSELQAKKNA